MSLDIPLQVHLGQEKDEDDVGVVESLSKMGLGVFFTLREGLRLAFH